MPVGPDPSRGPIGDGSHLLEGDENEPDPDRLYEVEIRRRYEVAHND